MPCTPLLRSIARLLREHAAADERSIPVEELREELAACREARITRRRLLAAGAAAAGVAMLPARVRAAASPPSIAIVGAGIAGMSAALTLHDAGLPFTVYEASDRVGGRMWTNTDFFEQGQHFELYGELIDTGHETIRGLAARFGLPLDHLPDSEPFKSDEVYFYFGSYYPKSQADEDFKQIAPALKRDLRRAGYPTAYNSSTAAGRALDNMSVYDWIESRVPGGHGSRLGALLDTAYWIELNAATTDQSALNIIYLLAYQPSWDSLHMFGVSDEVYKIRGGNQQLPQRIGQHIGSANIKLGWRLEKIKLNGSGDYDLTFRVNNRRKVITVDHVVLTIPFAVLRTLDYAGAGFDALKHTAIQELGRGRQSKQHLQFDRRLWYDQGTKEAPGNGSSYSDTGYQATWEATRGQAGTAGILVGYAGGPFADQMHAQTAFATSSEDQRVVKDAQDFLARAEPVFPGLTANWNGLAAQGLPHLNPNFNLSYSYYRVGQYQRFGRYEPVRQHNVHFAGEHTTMDFQGFMEGGALTGREAAEEVIADILG